MNETRSRAKRTAAPTKTSQLLPETPGRSGAHAAPAKSQPYGIQLGRIQVRRGRSHSTLGQDKNEKRNIQCSGAVAQSLTERRRSGTLYRLASRLVSEFARGARRELRFADAKAHSQACVLLHCI